MVTKGTLVRTILFLIALVNIVLTQTGHNPLQVSSNDLLDTINAIATLLILVVGFWKNNSYTKNALKADAWLKTLKTFNGMEDEANVISDDVNEKDSDK